MCFNFGNTSPDASEGFAQCEDSYCSITGAEIFVDKKLISEVSSPLGWSF
ncbi:hypothetical protein NWP26_05085 [Chrysosporum ovalisporum APH033B]|nr:hypothetical protein [Umezakia ovalisporum]MDH6066647.1 hypothetical protein [Umezakia ovalisporum APH033B]MDH6078252.1 hypothetical protein [Umezakia ovalisporum FSS-45]MDH6080941.1 hypothetical protein [Umezakia ovalisporum FSS-44]